MKKGFPMIMSLFLLAACSQSTASNAKKQVQNNPSNNEVEGYIYHDSKDVLFLQFTNTNGNLNGSYYDRWEDSNNQFQTYNSPLTGQIDGNTISITFKVSGHTFTGNVSNGEIDLAFPKAGGTISNIQFKPGTLNDFNTDVSQIQTSVSNDQQAAQQAQQNADLNKQLSDLEGAINTEMQSILKDEQSLQNDVQSTGKDSSSEETDLGTVKQDEQNVMKESPSDPQTGANANQVSADANQVRTDDINLKQMKKALQGDLSSLNSNFESMVKLANQLGAVIPNYIPKSSDVTQIVSKGNSIDQSTTASMNGYISNSKQMVDAANSLADKAQQHAGH